MKKQLVSLLLSLTLLLCAAPGLGETTGLSAAEINSLQSLTGEYGGTWQEGTAPSQSMNAFQMWQWLDWFLSSRVRSLLGSLQSLEQLSTSLDAQALSDQKQLFQLESTLSVMEERLEEDRLAITNGIRLLQSGTTGDADRERILNRISDAEDEIQQIIRTICADYGGYASLVSGCEGRLASQYGGYTQTVHSGALDTLASQAATLESSESKSGYTVSVLSTHQVGIRVLNAANQPISGATVTLADTLARFKQRTAKTDAQGEAIFFTDELGADENGEMKLSLHVEAAGYRTGEVQTLRLRSGETRTVSLQTDDGSPYLIMGSFNGRDILSETNTYTYTKQNTAKQAFTVKLSCAGAGELELRYAVDAASEPETVVKKFTAADSGRALSFEDQWLSKLLPGTSVTFAIKTGGEEYTIPANLVIQPAVVEAPVLTGDALFSFPGGMSTTLPGGAAFVGGSRLSLNLPNTLSRTAYLPSGAALYALGYDFKPEQADWQTRDAEDEARAIKAFELRGKADEALAAAGAHRDVNATVQSPMLDSNEAYVTPFAKLAGLYRAYDQSLSLSGAAGATVAFRSDITKTFADAVFTRLSGIASANLSMGEGFGMDVASETALDVTGGVPAVVGKPKTSFGTTVSLGMNLRSTSGLGVRESVLAALRSYGSVNATANPAAASLTASAGISTDISLREMLLASNGAGRSQRDYKGAREPHTPNPPISATGSEGLEPLETKVLFTRMDSAAGEIQIVQIGGDRYAFWIQPNDDSNNPVHVNWYNLDTNALGEVSHLQSGGSFDPNESVIRRNAYDDYAFAAEACGEYCALTILSGKFSGGTSSMTPSESAATTILMKRNNDSGLSMTGYLEYQFFDSDDYPVMPQVRLLMNGDDATILSAYTTDANAQQITGSLFRRNDKESENGKYLEKISELTRADSAQITRYSTASQQGTFYALNADGKLSRMTGSGPQVLAQGEIVSFKVLRGASVDRLFYLERVATQTGGYAYRLRSVTSDGTKKTDYGVDAGATLLDLASVDGGVYLYWKEYEKADAGAACLVRCVRYDPGTDTVSSPFSLMELPADTCGVKLMDGDAYEGYYLVDTKNSKGSYLRQSLSRFTYGPVASAELTAAVLTDPCVSAGDLAELTFSVKNTGNVPISGLNLRIQDMRMGVVVQMLHLDLVKPYGPTNTNRFSGVTLTGGDAARRISSLYDPLNHDALNIIQTTSRGDIVHAGRTDLLMPGDTYSYQAKLRVPADWVGQGSLVLRIDGVEGNPLSTFGSQAPNTTERIGSQAEKDIDTDAHDLMLSAQRITRNGVDYVHVTIRNRSGNTASPVTPVLTASCRGKALSFKHTLSNALGDGFCYSMDIPLKTLTGGASLPEVELHLSGAGDREFADTDNHVRLLLTAQLGIIEQPVSLPVTAGQAAAFSVAASGGTKPYSYQWQSLSGANQWKNIPGATQETYSIGSVKNDQNGLTVRCVVTDAFGDSVTSDPATLTVLPQTGDSSQLTLWLLLALASVAALAMMGRRRCCR